MNPSNRILVGLVALIASGCLGSNLGSTPKVLADLGPTLPDLTLPGPHQVARLEYDLGYMIASSPDAALPGGAPGRPFPVALRGQIHFPTDATGPFPVLLFMHGRHGTCELAGLDELGPVICPSTPVTTPIDSFRGYDYLAEPMAKLGYVVIGVNANNVNDLDNEYPDYGQTVRAQLIERTLDEFTKLNATAGPAPVAGQLIGHLDFSRIGLMGHSRGGEGVTRAITFNRDRTDGPVYKIRAVFALAPTDFFRWQAPDVAYAVLLPYCDGDVSDLQGSKIFDDARYLDEKVRSPKIQILTMGTDHNFYNTIWTGDDAAYSYGQDPVCRPDTGSQRLSASDQQRHGLLFMEAFFRAYVGGERALQGIFTGAAELPHAACPATRTSCDDAFHISYQAPRGARLVVEDARDDTALRQNDLGGATTLEGFTNSTVCEPVKCPTQPSRGSANRLTLGWTQNATYRTVLPSAAGDVSDFTEFTLRVGVAAGDARNAKSVPQDFRITLEDAAGHRAGVSAKDLGNATFYPPGVGSRKIMLNMVRAPLTRFGAVDLHHVSAIELGFGSTASGLVHVADLEFQRVP